MSLYVVSIKLPYENAASQFGVYHSNSSTMFAPVFQESDELIAHMFAAEFERKRAMLDPRAYTEEAQLGLVTELGSFLGAQFVGYENSDACLPIEWARALAEQCGEDLDEFFASTSSDLLDWYRDADPRAEVIQGLFHAWRKARV